MHSLCSRDHEENTKNVTEIIRVVTTLCYHFLIILKLYELLNCVS